MLYNLDMDNTELLKSSRNLLLALHKSLVDYERWVYEGVNGQVSSGEFLSKLLEDPELAWLRKFSTLIVDIDEMFAGRDGHTHEEVDAHLVTIRHLIGMNDEDQDFIYRYRMAIERDMDAARKQKELQTLLGLNLDEE